MILSYMLHGNIPSYNQNSPHPDPILHAKLQDSTQLLNFDIGRLTDHFGASRFSYSSQALPVNSLIDSLVRPHGETDDLETSTCIEWHHDPTKAVPHIVLGNAAQAGGQWTERPRGSSWDIQALSYAGMLSLPGYSFYEHYRRAHGTQLAPFTRPSRADIAQYLSTYPKVVGIRDSIRNGQNVWGVHRVENGFYIESHNIRCRQLVLATGIFTELKPARPLLQPLLNLPETITTPAPPPQEQAPLLVIGSGFSAADIIISADKNRKIVHIFKWEPQSKPSPLKSCHQQAYPEYAGIYRLMKRSALADRKENQEMGQPQKPWFRPGTLTPFLEGREWKDIYEGFPNTLVTDVKVEGATALVTLQCDNGTIVTRRIGGLSYAVGRRGSLNYLDNSLCEEILGRYPTNDADRLIAKDTLRPAAQNDLEVTRDVFIIGSLTGDSLIRFAYGGCFYTCGKLVDAKESRHTAADGNAISTEQHSVCADTNSDSFDCVHSNDAKDPRGTKYSQVTLSIGNIGNWIKGFWAYLLSGSG